MISKRNPFCQNWNYKLILNLSDKLLNLENYHFFHYYKMNFFLGKKKFLSLIIELLRKNVFIFVLV